VGTAVAGPLAGAFGTRAVLAAGAIVIVVLTIAVLCVPEVRHLERQKPAGSGQPGRSPPNWGCLAVEESDQPGGGDGPVSVLAQLGDLRPVQVPVEPDTDPAPAAHIRRPEEPVRLGCG
jgi:hypothetical protein